MWAYWGNCVDATAEDIDALRDSAEQITWRTFRSHIPDAKAFFIGEGGLWKETTNEQVENSCFFTFYRGIFREQRCYFATWSGYEWIWTSR